MILPNNDTVVALTMTQVDSINLAYVTLDEFVEKDSIKTEIIKDYRDNEKTWKSLNNEKNILINRKDSIITIKDSIIFNREIVINEKDKQIKVLKIKKTVAGALSILFGLIVIF